jgi:hypothetical protein
MSNGPTEKIDFTRGDAEKITRLERDIEYIRNGVTRNTYILYSVGMGILLILIEQIIKITKG